MKSSKNNKILYIAPSLSSFIRSDISILSNKYLVLINTYTWSKKFFTPFYLLHQLFFLIKHIGSTKKIIISFGGYWSFLPTFIGKLAHVDVFIILNGTDCASIPPIRYGDLRKFPLKTIIRFSLKTATLLLPVSKSLISVKNTYFSNDKYSYQGYKHFFPEIKTKHKVVSNGFDTDFWKPLSKIKREPKTFIAVFSSSQFILKGGDMIVQLAKDFPDCEFYIAGMDEPDFIEGNPENLIFLGKLSPETLRDYYNRATFFFQLSIFEGFGCALSEAMLCNCIPIGSSVNIIPEIIGDTGFILKKRDSEELQNIIRKVLAIENKETFGKAARERIVQHYDIEKRKQVLFSLLEY